MSSSSGGFDDCASPSDASPPPTRSAPSRWLMAATIPAMRPLFAAIVAVALLPAAARAADVADVDPLVGTGARVADIRAGGGAGATVPGAAVPFGLVQMSPETAPATSAFGAGYDYADTR